MGLTEEVMSYNELVSKAVLAFDRDLLRIESAVEALDALGRQHTEKLACIDEHGRRFGQIQATLDRMTKELEGLRNLDQEHSTQLTHLNASNRKLQEGYEGLRRLTCALQEGQEALRQGLQGAHEAATRTRSDLDSLMRDFRALQATQRRLPFALSISALGLAVVACALSAVALVGSVVGF